MASDEKVEEEKASEAPAVDPEEKEADADADTGEGDVVVKKEEGDDDDDDQEATDGAAADGDADDAPMQDAGDANGNIDDGAKVKEEENEEKEGDEDETEKKKVKTETDDADADADADEPMQDAEADNDNDDDGDDAKDDEEEAKKDSEAKLKEEDDEDEEGDAAAEEAKAETKPKAKRGRKRKSETEKAKPPAVKVETKTPSKRGRKSTPTEVFSPGDFKTKKDFKIIDGRGLKIRDIPSVKENIDQYAPSGPEMTLAHKLLYSVRGKISKKDMKSHVMDFSGYLAYLPENYDKKKFEKDDDEAETKYSTKAFKFTAAEIKTLCAFFNVKTTGASKKDDLIDMLLDFLGAPDPNLVNKKPQSKPEAAAALTKKTPGRPKKEKAKAPDNEDDDEDDDEEEENAPADATAGSDTGDFSLIKKLQEGEVPSEEALKQWVRAYVACFDMDGVTITHAMKTASAKFGVDLSDQKDLMKDLLADAM